MKLSDLSNRELLRGLVGVLSNERSCIARMVAYLAEVEERRLHLLDACSSLFDFCQRRLGLSEGEAFRRINAARLARRFPSILGRLERGELHLSALELLARHLTDDNHEDLLSATARKTKREVQELLAAQFPREDVPTTIELLPPTGSVSPTPSRVPPPAKARIEPLSADRCKVQFTASTELRDKLERATRLMSHQNPSGDMTVVLDRALDLLIASLEKQRLGKTSRPARARSTAAAEGSENGHVTRAALREVVERDGEQCTFRNESGERCPARAFLEIDHVHARACGGDGAPDNLRILCRAHNRLAAERTFGRDHVARKVQLSRERAKARSPERLERARSGIAMPSSAASVPAATKSDVGELAVCALTSMGFRADEARKAVLSLLENRGGQSAATTIEEVLRRALAVLTATPSVHRGRAR